MYTHNSFPKVKKMIAQISPGRLMIKYNPGGLHQTGSLWNSKAAHSKAMKWPGFSMV